MDIDCISYDSINFLPPLIQDYLNSNKELAKNYSFAPNIEGFSKAIESRKLDSGIRNILAETLLNQYANVPDNERQLKSIELLKQQNTFTVTTGHQLCLFTGPLYFIYKILSVVKLSEELKAKFPQNNFVPIYWMATEDHDFEEINHFIFKGKKVEWKSDFGDAVGRMDADLVELSNSFKDLLGPGKNAKYLSKLFEESYKNRNLAEATQILVHKLLGDFGIVIIDADNKDLKRVFIPVMKLEIESHVSQNEVSNTSDALLKQGYKTQVNPRDINLFYLNGGKRLRLSLTKNGVEIVDGGKSWSTEEILSDLNNFPERFSPNVILRPVYQECILPNLSYTGGVGELSYWFQLKSTFDAFKIQFPILLLRNSGVVIGKNDITRLSKLNLKVDDLFKDVLELEKQVVSSFTVNEVDLLEEKKELGFLFNTIKEKAITIDKSLNQTTDASLAKAIKVLDKLEKKLARSEKLKHGVHLEQLHHVLEGVYPNGTFQERRNNFSDVYLELGDDFFNKMKDAFSPLRPDITVLKID
ncbi:MAG: bacillithiol biosynthesis cysteine-adding enzyme BshC [Salibacteraceae bacterium]